jgi:hypothetical protein
MTIFADGVSLASGTTVDTFGTSANVILNSRAKKILAVIAIAVDQTFTAAEGSAIRLRMNSSGVKDFAGPADWMVGSLETSGPATNSSGQGALQEITPWDITTVGGETLTFDAAPTSTITTARLLEVTILYSDGNVPQDIIDNLPSPPVRIKGAFTVDASQLTTVPTALASITVPGWAKEIVGCKAVMHKTGAITAGEEVLGFMNLTGTIADMGVQRYPTNGIGATLGTPVGTGQYEARIPWLPMHIPTPGKDITITPNVNLRTAVTTANRVAFTLAWR